MIWEDIIKCTEECDGLCPAIALLKQAEREGKVCLIPELTAGEKRMIGTDVEICQSKSCANCRIGCVRKSIFLKKRSGRSVS